MNTPVCACLRVLLCVNKTLQVVERRDGVLQAMQVGKSYVDMTTVDATTASVISDVGCDLNFYSSKYCILS